MLQADLDIRRNCGCLLFIVYCSFRFSFQWKGALTLFQSQLFRAAATQTALHVRQNKLLPVQLPATVGIIFLCFGTNLTVLTAETSLLVFMCVSHLESPCSGGISGAQVALWAPGRWSERKGVGCTSSRLRWDYRLLTLDDTSCFQHIAHLVAQKHVAHVNLTVTCVEPACVLICTWNCCCSHTVK